MPWPQRPHSFEVNVGVAFTVEGVVFEEGWFLWLGLGVVLVCC